MAQLVERSLPIPEGRGSNPVIGKNLYLPFTLNCIERTKIKKKRPGMVPFLKKTNKRPRLAHDVPRYRYETFIRILFAFVVH